MDDIEPLDKTNKFPPYSYKFLRMNMYSKNLSNKLPFILKLLFGRITVVVGGGGVVV